MFSNDTFLGRAARYPLSFLPSDMVLPVFAGPARGNKFIVGSGLYSYWLGSYEPEKQRRVVRELKPDSVFFDIGANVGFYSLLAARIIAPAKAYAFEPLPSNIAYLRKHLELNDVKNVELLEIALSDRVGTASFVEAENNCMGHLVESGGVEVETATIDSLVSEQKVRPPNCIKIDIEGAELVALQAAAETFRRFRPVLFLATHGREIHMACRQLLGSWGYKCEEFGEDDSLDRGEMIARYART